MSTIPERQVENSPLGGHITRGSCTVQVHIYRLAGTEDEWTLDVVDEEGGHTVWEETFADDQDALEAFEKAVAEDGIRSFAEGPIRH